MNEKAKQKIIWLRTVIVFCITFILAIIFCHFLNSSQIKEEKMKATYTAEATVNRIESISGGFRFSEKYRRRWI